MLSPLLSLSAVTISYHLFWSRRHHWKSHHVPLACWISSLGLRSKHLIMLLEPLLWTLLLSGNLHEPILSVIHRLGRRWDRCLDHRLWWHIACLSIFLQRRKEWGRWKLLQENLLLRSNWAFSSWHWGKCRRNQKESQSAWLAMDWETHWS